MGGHAQGADSERPLERPGVARGSATRQSGDRTVHSCPAQVFERRPRRPSSDTQRLPKCALMHTSYLGCPLSIVSTVHPQIATRWSAHLKSSKLVLVMVANTGYHPSGEHTNFSCRIVSSLRKLPEAEQPNLMEILLEFGGKVEDQGFMERVGGNFAKGHKQASGGIILSVRRPHHLGRDEAEKVTRRSHSRTLSFSAKRWRSACRQTSRARLLRGRRRRTSSHQGNRPLERSFDRKRKARGQTGGKWGKRGRRNRRSLRDGIRDSSDALEQTHSMQVAAHARLFGLKRRRRV